MKEINWVELRSSLMSYSSRFISDYNMSEDLVQDTILEIWNKNGLHNVVCVEAYAKTALKNRWINLVKQETRSSFFRGMLESMRYNDREKARSVIYQITKGESDFLKELIHMRSIDRSYREIAYMLNSNPELCRKYFSNFKKGIQDHKRCSVWFNFGVRLAVEGLDLFKNYFALYGNLDKKREGIIFNNGKDYFVRINSYCHRYDCDVRIEIKHDILFCSSPKLLYNEKKSLEKSLKNIMQMDIYMR